MTTVTDPLGNPIVYQLDRDTVSSNVKVTSISGDCPTCGLGPNTQLFYDDPSHPMLPTRTVDGRGYTTAMSYDRLRPGGEPHRGDGRAGGAHDHLDLRRDLPGAGRDDRAALGGRRRLATDHRLPAGRLGQRLRDDDQRRRGRRRVQLHDRDHLQRRRQPRDDRPAGPRHRRRDHLHLRPGPRGSRRRLPDRPDRRHDHLRPRPLPPAGRGHRPERRRDRDRLRPSRPGDRGPAARRNLAGRRPGDDLRVHRLRRPGADDPAGGNVVEYGYDAAGRLESVERKPDARPRMGRPASGSSTPSTRPVSGRTKSSSAGTRRRTADRAPG